MSLSNANQGQSGVLCMRDDVNMSLHADTLTCNLSQRPDNCVGSGSVTELSFPSHLTRNRSFRRLSLSR